VLAHRSASASRGVGGYFMEVPRALPAGLHDNNQVPSDNTQVMTKIAMVESFKRILGLVVWILGHWNLFGICYLDFGN
jgi:hypothetical protein